MKFRVILTALFVLPLLINTVSADEKAEEVVRITVEQVTDKLVAEKTQLETNPDLIYGLIEDMVVPHFDFPIIARLVLGKTTWNDATEDQKETFIREFTTLLVRTYAKALQEYSDEEIAFLTTSSNPNSNLVEVRTEIKDKASGSRTPINYRMHISQGNWKVIDLVVDGISLVNSYRGEYRSIIRKNGFQGLIVKMQEKNSST